MSLTRPIRPYHFQADLIWWDGPFNANSTPSHDESYISFREQLQK
jgi:hypothetical protein